MQSRTIHWIFAIVVFGISLAQYLLTVQPSVSFWDAGEIAAATKLLQVPHPPGAPLSLLVGRLFYLLPLSESMGFRVNLLSVFSTSFAVLFLYLSIAKLLGRMPASEHEGIVWQLARPMAAAIGALSFSFCDTLWFNGVEAEVFALSTFIFAFIFWLTLVWLENPDGTHSTKILLLIAYLTGLSAGVHLMSVLAVASVAFLVVIVAYVRNDATCKKSALVLLGHIGVMSIAGSLLLNAQTNATPPTYEQFHAFDIRFASIMGAISVLWVAVFKKRVFTRDSIYFPLAVAGVALAICYPGIVKYLPKVLVAIAGDNNIYGLMVLVLLLAVGTGVMIWAGRRRKAMAQFVTGAIVLAMAGYTVYATIVIRANEDPPMNENAPKTFSGLGTYISREQYGDWPVFKRRFSSEPHQRGVYTQYSSDLDFLLRYQMGHMFTRYLLWNYVGRISTVQDVGVQLGQMYGVPFLIGLVGMLYHFRKDWKVATALLLLFLLMGYITAYYQNQQEPQPRERDYFYPGAFFVFSVWIGLGLDGIMRFAARRVASKKIGYAFAAAILVLGILFIPVRMLQTNYASHDRSQNWVPWDYSYNILQSCEQDAILFTNGDNDTFPLWFLQDVEGIRRDVRIVNLSLANTPWYVQQMKNAPYYSEAKAVPISIPDADVATISPTAWEPREVSLNVSDEVYGRYNVTDTATTNLHKISWRMNHTLQQGSAKGIRVQDMLVLNILMTNRWTRPVCFAVTCASDSKLGLDEYLWYRGFVWRLEPRRVPPNGLGLDHAVLEESLLHEKQGFSKTPQLGYKYRGLSDPKVFLEEHASRMLVNYRMAFLRLALSYANDRRDSTQSAATLDRMEQVLPRAVRPMDLGMASDIMFFYHRLGRTSRFAEMAVDVEQECKRMIADGMVNMNSYENPYRVLLDIYEIQDRRTEAIELLTKLDRLYPNSPEIVQRLRAAQSALKQGV